VAGDIKQLPPQDPSETAHNHPLGEWLTVSIQEYLISTTPRVEAVKLIRNFRSHPAIVRLVSDLFYKNGLIEDENSTMAQPTAQTTAIANTF